MSKLADDQLQRDLAKSAGDLLKILEKFDEIGMSVALSHSHQLLQQEERKSSMAGDTDPQRWNLSIVKGNVGQLEQLLESGAYDKFESRMTFVSYYDKVLRITKFNSEGEA